VINNEGFGAMDRLSTCDKDIALALMEEAVNVAGTGGLDDLSFR
jgi:hypothetical protein